MAIVNQVCRLGTRLGCVAPLLRTSCRNGAAYRISLSRAFSGRAKGINTFSDACKLGGVLGGVIGGALSFTWVLRNETTLLADDGSARKHHVTRKVVHDSDKTGLKLTLYQYSSCPFCCKLRAFLDCYGFSYDVVEVNSVWRTELKWSKYRKVPILVCKLPGQDKEMQLVDSTVIISTLGSYVEDKSQSLEQLKSFYPPLESKDKKGKTVIEYPNKYFLMFGEKTPEVSQKDLKLERKWRKWTDDVLIHMISPNVYRTPSEALQTFHHFSKAGNWEENFTTFERYTVIYVGAAAMYFIGKLLKKKHNLKSDVRESLYDACREWTAALGKTEPFMGGQKPNLADLAAFGALSSFEGCEAWEDAVRHTDIGSWYQQTKTAVATSALGSKLQH